MADVTAKLAEAVLDYCADHAAAADSDPQVRVWVGVFSELLAAYEQAQAAPFYNDERSDVASILDSYAAPVAQAAKAELEELVQAGWVLVEEAPAPEAAPAPAPQGWKLVPVEPTPEMVKALKAKIIVGNQGGVMGVASAYRAMLAAAPSQGKEASK